MQYYSILIPCYNEYENLLKLLPEIDQNLIEKSKFEIIVIDDASSDNTYNIKKKIKLKIRLKLITNHINKGQSFSIHKGVRYSQYETIITIDGDGQNNPVDIPKLLKYYYLNKNIKLIGGIRLKRKDSIVKIISSKIANYVRRKILNDDCMDTGCSLKIFDKNIFLIFPYFDGMHRFLPALFKGYGHKTSFVEVGHRNRKYGYSKYGTMNRLFKGVRDIIKVRNIIKYKNND